MVEKYSMCKFIKKEKGGVNIIDLILLVIVVFAVIFIFEYIIPDKKVSSQNTYSGYEASTSNSSNQYKRYFYEQLSDNGKKIYNAILNNIDIFKEGYGKIEIDINEQGIEKEFQATWDALNLDVTDMFYVDTQKISFSILTSTNIFGRSTYKYYIQPKENTFFLDYWNNSYDVKDAISKVETKANQIIQNMTATTRYEQVKYIHDYLIDNMEYNQAKDVNNSNIYGALIEGKAVCEGYAEAFKYLLDKLDIPCILVYGDGINSNGETEYHSWNQVMMDDNKWYSVDVTWDDPILIGYGKLPEKSRYKFFLKGSQNFDSSHVKEHDVSGTGQYFTYMETSVTDYVR